jgi:hypothetical protein
MNIKQELPWDNPRFRNWVAVARACHVLERTLAVKKKNPGAEAPGSRIESCVTRQPPARERIMKVS